MKRLSKNTKKKTNKLQVVFIDWDGTLSPTKFWSHLEKSEKQSDRKLFKLWTKAMFIGYKDKINPWMRGGYTSEEIISLVSKKTDTDFETILKEFIIGCEQMEYSSPSIPKLVRNLRSKSIMAVIATNNMDCFSRWTVPSMKLDSVFDEIINSFYLKALKHDLNERGEVLFFKDFFNKYAIEPADCVFLDDGEDKMNVISNFGIDYRRIDILNTLERELRNILADL